MTGPVMSEGLRFGVVVSSTRAADGRRPDRTGPVIADWVNSHGWTLERLVIVADGPPVRAAIEELVASGCSVVLTTGGTGFSPDDHTPEITADLIDRPAPGLAEAIRARGLRSTPMAALSRATAGIIGNTLVVNLAGSLGAVRDGLEVLEGILPHALDQMGHGPIGSDGVHK